jgi:hypothetical protein
VQGIILEGKAALVFHVHAEGAQCQDVRVQTPTADHVTTRWGQLKFPNARGEWSCDQNRGADTSAKVWVQIGGSQVSGSDSPGRGVQILYLCA